MSYHTEDIYLKFHSDVRAVGGLVCLAITQKLTIANRVSRNFLARSITTSDSIFTLYSDKSSQDAWVLHRTLIERLLLLNHLSEKSEFEEFDNWSFFTQAAMANKVKSDLKFKEHHIPSSYTLSSEKAEQLKMLEKAPPKWKRPKAEDMAKSMNLGFLYRYGYDFASSHVHPMANDGEHSFHNLFSDEVPSIYDENIVILHNTSLILLMTIREAINASNYKWREEIFDLGDQMLAFLDKGKGNYSTKHVDVTKLFTSGNLAEAQ